jgi:hypothetical protein
MPAGTNRAASPVRWKIGSKRRVSAPRENQSGATASRRSSRQGWAISWTPGGRPELSFEVPLRITAAGQPLMLQAQCRRTGELTATVRHLFEIQPGLKPKPGPRSQYAFRFPAGRPLLRLRRRRLQLRLHRTGVGREHLTHNLHEFANAEGFDQGPLGSQPARQLEIERCVP